MQALKNVRVIVGLGKVGFDSTFNVVKALGMTTLTSRPKFSHHAVVQLSDSLTLIGSYHPSQQNTFTGKLTEKMLDDIFLTVRKLLKKKSRK